MTSPDVDRTTVSVYLDVHKRLNALRRKIGVAENTDPSMSDTIKWLLDQAEKAGLL